MRIAAVTAAGGVLAFVLMLGWLGLRPDLATAMGGATFWSKAGYAAVLGVAGFLAIERLARPAASPRAGLLLALAALVLIVALAAVNLLTTPPADRLTVWLGGSWRRCPFNILALSGPTLVLALLAVRGLAPTRLRAAGAAAGLLAGGVATTAYSLHCPETAPAFVATWYTLGIFLSATVGAILGPWALRWR
jgi:hypothetical protein